MLILGLLGMYFDATVVFFTISSLLFRMAIAMLCCISFIINEKYKMRNCKEDSRKHRVPGVQI